MDTNNGRSTPPSGEATMDTGDWRTQLQPVSRQQIVNKIMDTLKRHLPFSGSEGLNELRKIAVRFEEKIFTAASSQSDYLRRISLKMLTMEMKSQNTVPSTGNNSKPPDPGSQGMQNQVHSQGQSIPIPLQSNQSQACQQLLPQNVPNNMATAGVQSSAGLQSGMPSVCDLTQNPMPNAVGQNSNMQSMSGISQNSLGQGMPSNIFANQQRQIQGRQQMLLQQQQQQQKQQQHQYHQQLQHQLLKQKIQQGNLQPSLMQPHMQQQQQQNLLPPTQLQSSQQSDSTAQTGHANGGDWQEEVYQKIKTMKETYLPELNEMYQKIAAKLQQHDSLPQQPKSEQLEKLKIFKNMLERIITFLTVSKANILPAFKDKLSSYEKQIINFINTNRPRKSVSGLQQGQLPPPHMHSMQQPQPQINQTQSHDSQMNPQLQSINLQGSVPTMKSNNMTSLQHNSLSSLPVVSTAQQTMLNSLQPGSNLDSGQGNALGSMQQVAPGSLQQNPVSSSQQANINSLSSQSGLSVLQQNMNPLQSNSNMLQRQHLKEQEQQMLQSQNKLKQFHQRQIQHQFMQQKHPLLQQQQQFQQQAKQQLPTQLQTHQMPQLHQMNDVNDMRLEMGVKPGVFQHLPGGQHQPYTHQQLKPGAQYPTSSPQLLQAASPQMPQHSSPQIDQQSLLTSISKTGTPLQSANSPFVVPSPSTPLAPSPLQPHMQQQQQQNLLPPTQLQTSQQSASLDSTAQTGHANGGDWQEEVYQKIKTMKETYLPELNEMYQKIADNLQQHDYLPQQPMSEQLEKLKIFKTMLERIITFLSVSKANILPAFKDKMSSYEKQIVNFINTNRPRKSSVSALQQGQRPPPHMHSMQQPQPQINQTQSHDSQMNPQLQSINLQGSVPTMQSNNLTSLQHNFLSSLPVVSTAQQNMLNSLQPGSNLDSDEQSKPGAQFLTSSPSFFRAPFVPSTSTLLTPSPTPGCSEKPINGPSSLTNYRNICHHQATGEQARSECPVPDTPGKGISTPLLLAGFENGNDTHGNALLADFGKSNVEEQRHDPRVIMAKPMSLKSLSASVVTMVDEAGAAVGEDLAAMRKRGLHARNFFAQTGMTGADKMRCYMSAIVILVLLFWCIFILHQQN